jgi:glycosyltransferase involved in cell wall biosynthesis
MRVLHIAETAQGGVGSYLEEVVPLQVRRYGASCLRVVLPDEHARHFPQLSGEWLSAFPLEDATRCGAAVRMAARALREIGAWHPDVVHLHSTFAGLLMRPLLALRHAAPRVVYCPHGWAFDRQAGTVQTALARTSERLLSRWCDRVLCVSEHELVRARELGLPTDLLQLVRNGIREAQAVTPPGGSGDDPWPPGPLRVLFVGRLDRQKGADILYSAMAQLQGRAHAVVVGATVAGAGNNACEAPANVTHVGWRSRGEIETLYASADVLVVPSRWEALGLVALEAMRAGLPVVASRVGGLPEVVEEGCTGLVIEPENPRVLVEALSSLDQPTLRRMGACARERFLQHFQVDRVVDQLHEAYSSDPGRAVMPPGQLAALGRERP